jgi:hypothetical protein
VSEADLDARRYEPVGRCIYCGSTKNLTDEHIFPKFLWGHTVLPKASCECCRRLTSAFELTCAHFIFGRFRIVHDLPTDHPRRRPTELSIEIEKGGDIQSVEVPITDYPGAPLFLLTWVKPGILRGARRSDTVLQGLQFHFIMTVPRDIEERFTRIGVSPGTYAYVPIGFEVVSFAQFIAKVTHALAVAEFGIESFDPYLTPLIRGRYRDVPFLTGANRDHPPFSPEKDHRGSFEIVSRGKKKYLCCNLQFLTRFKLPVFQTVVGRPTRELEKWIKNPSIRLRHPQFTRLSQCNRMDFGRKAQIDHPLNVLR